MSTPQSELTILEEVWENQRYRLVGWTRPFPMDGGFQGFGDRLGDTLYSKDRFPELSPPAGWAWIDEEWQLDVSWADVDEEGWCYAPSFSALKEQLLVGAVSASKTSSDFVRRRRWTRRRKCEDGEAQQDWDKYLEHLHQRQEAEQKRLRRRETCFEEVRQFETARAAAAAAAFRKADHELLAQGCRLAESFDLLLALKVLLKRRSDLDRRYVSVLHSFLARFAVWPRRADAPAGAKPPPPPTPPPLEGDAEAAAAGAAAAGAPGAAAAAPSSRVGLTAAAAGRSSEPLYEVLDEVTDEALQLQQDFSDGLSGMGNADTFSTLWDRMGGEDVLRPQWQTLKCVQNFCGEMEGLVLRADHLINEMGDAMQSCADMRRHLRSRLQQREEECKVAWKAYNATYDTLCLDSANRVQKIRLILNDPAQLMNARRTDTEADVGDAGKGPDKTDLWIAENAYRNAANASMSACLGLAKNIPRILLRVAELDGAASFLVKTGGRQFLHSQQRMFNAIADAFGGGNRVEEEAGKGDAKEEEPEQAKIRLEALMKEASERSRMYSAESIEASLPTLEASRLVVRAALAQRYTLESADALFSKAAQDQLKGQKAEGGTPEDSQKSPRPGFSKQPVLVVFTVDGFLHIFDAENSTFDPERIASRGAQLSLDVRPHVKGVEVADSNVAPNAIRVRGALQRSVFRLSAGGLFDVVLAEWSPNLFPLNVVDKRNSTAASHQSAESAETDAEETERPEGLSVADEWKTVILHPLMEFGLPVNAPRQPGKLVLLSAPNSYEVEDEAEEATGMDYADLLVSFGSRSGSEDVTSDKEEDIIPEDTPPERLNVEELLTSPSGKKAAPRRRLVPVESGDGPSDLEMLMDPFSGSQESQESQGSTPEDAGADKEAVVEGEPAQEDQAEDAAAKTGVPAPGQAEETAGQHEQEGVAQDTAATPKAEADDQVANIVDM